jgi:heme-degrading monooxygenase HmoA
MVISTWRSIEDWNDWVKNDKRIAIQEEIDDLLGVETEYEVYE